MEIKKKEKDLVKVSKKDEDMVEPEHVVFETVDPQKQSRRLAVGTATLLGERVKEGDRLSVVLKML